LLQELSHRVPPVLFELPSTVSLCFQIMEDFLIDVNVLLRQKGNCSVFFRLLARIIFPE